MTEKFYTVQEVAALLNYHQVTILKRIRQGKLQATRSNGDTGVFRISEEALQKYLAQGQTTREISGTLTNIEQGALSVDWILYRLTPELERNVARHFSVGDKVKIEVFTDSDYVKNVVNQGRFALEV